MEKNKRELFDVGAVGAGWCDRYSVYGGELQWIEIADVYFTDLPGVGVGFGDGVEERAGRGLVKVGLGDGFNSFEFVGAWAVVGSTFLE